ncbi:MAG: hypothetical protein AVDCRST_MAG37-2902 [uncultured Rubrobacteraceae bacterium]|uniref:HD-GYP domain-containing protein n=1 Tax=uncultured Rubrobacteraceae bacterium TaxID=349277 RepID=A0A6J4QU99_9ACTN|nr:MAG: hypothetical protein AVDCRST_MAG37-2902 [uncultured Rubrobacteraceae bacterium]
MPRSRSKHEHWDGKGYPDNLSGERIPLASRVILAFDAFHAMTSDRPYRRAIEVQAALEELDENAGEQFDPDTVKALLEIVGSHLSARKGSSRGG